MPMCPLSNTLPSHRCHRRSLTRVRVTPSGPEPPTRFRLPLARANPLHSAHTSSTSSCQCRSWCAFLITRRRPNQHMLPTRRLGNEKQKMKCEFSMVRGPNRVLTSLKSASFEIRISSFVHRSPIFVLGGVNMSECAQRDGPATARYVNHVIRVNLTWPKSCCLCGCADCR
jgi:hypothetical protein